MSDKKSKEETIQGYLTEFVDLIGRMKSEMPVVNVLGIISSGQAFVYADLIECRLEQKAVMDSIEKNMQMSSKSGVTVH